MKNLQLTKIIPVTLLPLMLLVSANVYAETPEEKGKAIAIEADKRESG